MRLIWLILCTLGCASESKTPETVDDQGEVPPLEPGDEPGPTPDPEVPCGEGTPSVVLGTGDEAFVPLDSGDGVTMVHGPQGGWHILGSLQARHIHPVVDISYTIQSPLHSETVSMNNYRVLLTEGDDCTGTFVGMYGYLVGLPGEDFDDIYIPDLLGGLTLELKMEIRDLNGVELTGTIEVMAELDPVDLESDTGGP